MDQLEMVHFNPNYIAPLKLTMNSGKKGHFALAPFQLLLLHFLPLKACFPIAGSLK